MKKTIFITFILSLSVIIAGYLLLGKKTSSPSYNIKGEKSHQAILYYGDTCPHCQKVADWLEKNPKIKEKSALIEKEVYNNKTNAQELGMRAKECQIKESEGIGVPFLYDKGKCVMGDQPIIDYLSSKYQ